MRPLLNSEGGSTTFSSSAEFAGRIYSSTKPKGSYTGLSSRPPLYLNGQQRLRQSAEIDFAEETFFLEGDADTALVPGKRDTQPLVYSTLKRIF